MPLIAEIQGGNRNLTLKKKIAGLVEESCNKNINNLQSLSGVKGVIGESYGMAKP